MEADLFCKPRNRNPRNQCSTCVSEMPVATRNIYPSKPLLDSLPIFSPIGKFQKSVSRLSMTADAERLGRRVHANSVPGTVMGVFTVMLCSSMFFTIPIGVWPTGFDRKQGVSLWMSTRKNCSNNAPSSWIRPSRRTMRPSFRARALASHRSRDTYAKTRDVVGANSFASRAPGE